MPAQEWIVNKEINVGHLITSLIAVCSAIASIVVWSFNLDTRISVLETRQMAIEANYTRLENRLIKIEDRLIAIQDMIRSSK